MSVSQRKLLVGSDVELFHCDSLHSMGISLLNNSSHFHWFIFRPISKVSIRYNAPSDQKQPDQANQHEQNSEIVRVHEVVRCKSAESLRQVKEVRVEKEIYDYLSEIDEDRVIVDVDQIVKDAEIEEYADSPSVEQLSEIVGEKGSEVDDAFHRGLSHKSEEKRANCAEQQVDMQFEGSKGKNAVEERPQVEYIPSYSKFQKLKERKKTALSDDSDVDYSRNTGRSSKFLVASSFAVSEL